MFRVQTQRFPQMANRVFDPANLNVAGREKIPPGCVARIESNHHLCRSNVEVQLSLSIVPGQDGDIEVVAWKDLKPEFSHLIRRVLPEHHAPRWTVRITNVFGRVVIRILHREYRASREEQPSGVSV